jgi:hypothetical protein
MKKIIGIIGILAAAILMFAAASFWLDLRMAHGSTRSESQVQTFTAGVEQGQPKPAIHQLTVYVDEPGYMQGSVRQGLVKRIQDTRGIQDLRVVSELPQPGEGPVLFVEVTPLQFLWLPVFTRANLEVHMVYSSDGDMSWMDHQAVVMESSPLERLRGDFNVADTSFGLMTLRGQARYLGRQTADELLKAIDANLY